MRIRHSKSLKIIISVSLLLFLFNCSKSVVPETASLKDESLKTMFILVDKLIELQISDTDHPDYGAIQCPHCNVLHTRASEAVYPFVVAFTESGDAKYLQAAIQTGNWLIRQQQPTGEWIETPWDWTGTTADQLLMMSLAYPVLKEHLSSEEIQIWEKALIDAAEFLLINMSPDWASINYCATTPATLMMLNRVIPDTRYVEKAKELARWTVAKMDEDGFITGEAARMNGVKYGVDPGYEMDMSFWGLELYARENNDTFVHQKISHAMSTHLNLVYPDGGIDGSWGARCYKWTTYGSKTADGSQILFSLFANENPQYRTAGIRNLRYLNTMIRDGMIGYGPQYFKLFDTPPCNYSTFARSKNLALAAVFGEQQPGEIPSLPADQPGWLKFYPTVDVAIARTENFMATISAYRYKDPVNWGAGKYTHRPTGGSVTNLWVKDFGLLQTSSQTRYVRGEPMHMPVIEDTVISLTPRIEYRDKTGYFTNLYETNGRIYAEMQNANVATIKTTGELCNSSYLPGGVAYSWEHKINDDFIQKEVQLRYHDRLPDVQIVEPIVQHQGFNFIKSDPATVTISDGTKTFRFTLVEGNAEIEIGKNEENYWYPFPSLKCYPITLKLPAPAEKGITKIVYRISIE